VHYPFFVQPTRVWKLYGVPNNPANSTFPIQYIYCKRTGPESSCERISTYAVLQPHIVVISKITIVSQNCVVKIKSGNIVPLRTAPFKIICTVLPYYRGKYIIVVIIKIFTYWLDKFVNRERVLLERGAIWACNSSRSYCWHSSSITSWCACFMSAVDFHQYFWIDVDVTP
jgi:hypothetical protein